LLVVTQRSVTEEDAIAAWRRKGNARRDAT